MSAGHVTRILLKTQKPSQLLAAFVGCFIGFTLIITALQSYFNFQFVFNDSRQSISSQYYVINKKVNVLNSLNKNKSLFSSNDIKEVSELPSVKKVSRIVPNHFSAFADLEFQAGDVSESLKTDMFLEGVDDYFLGVDSNELKWVEGQRSIPLMLPTNFINLYNFIYAPAKGLPQISKKTLQLFKFKIYIDNHGTKEEFSGNIVGFNDNITSMIAPMSFINYANTQYSNGNITNDDNIYRLMVEVEPSKLSSFQQFLKENEYETNEQLLKSGKVASLMQAVLVILLLLGGVMVFNAFSGFLLYLQLVVARSQYELETLLRLGYKHVKLVAWYAAGIGLILSSIGLAGFGALFFIHQKSKDFISKYDFEFPPNIHPLIVGIGFGILLVLFILFLMAVYRQIFRLALPFKKN